MTGDSKKKPFKENSAHHKAEKLDAGGYWLHGFGATKPIYDNGATVKRVIKRSKTKK